MADYSRPIDWKFEALQSARYQYDDWQEWQKIVDEGWSTDDPEVDWVVCFWCAGVFYQPIRELHRTKCKSSLESDVPEPVRYETIKEYQLDIPLKERSESNRRLYPY